MSEHDDKVDFTYEVLKNIHEKELARRRELDEKADRLIQCISIVTGITIGLGTTFIRETLTLLQLCIPYFLGIGLLVLSIAVSLWSSRVIRWHEAPDIRNILHQGRNDVITKIQMKKQAIVELEEAFYHNFDNNQNKAKAIGFSWILMLAGLITLVIFLSIFVQTPIVTTKS